MHDSESALEEKTYKILWNSKIQTDHLISARQLTYRIIDFAVSVERRVKLKEMGKRDKYLEFVRELKKKNNGT